MKNDLIHLAQFDMKAYLLGLQRVIEELKDFRENGGPHSRLNFNAIRETLQKQIESDTASGANHTGSSIREMQWQKLEALTWLFSEVEQDLRNRLEEFENSWGVSRYNLFTENRPETKP